MGMTGRNDYPGGCPFSTSSNLVRVPKAMVSPVLDVIARWRADAALFRRYGDTRLAAVCELHADEIEASVRQAGDARLTLVEAARESGFSVDHLGRLLRSGKLANAGRKNAPRILRSDLPRKAGSLSSDESA